ncbi:MAG: hypothetical protein II401_11410 [Bacteroidales bacterium]|nr:hypothetical protein [Bacteroidales bacterium]
MNRFIFEIWNCDFSDISDTYKYNNLHYDSFEIGVNEACDPSDSHDIHANLWEYMEEDDRKRALECLRKALPKGYVLNVDNETIDVSTADDYLHDTIKRIQSISPSLPIDNPLNWWREEVCLYHDIMILDWERNLMTLNEFLLNMITLSKDEENRKLYIGLIVKY